MARVLSSFTVAPDAAGAVTELVEQLRAQAPGDPVAGGLVQCAVGYPLPALCEALRAALPGVPFVGVTSCQGLATDRGMAPAGPGLSALWLVGQGVRVQVASSPQADAARLTGSLLPPDGRSRFALVHPTPGLEERLLEGLVPALGPEVSLVGGTAADDDLSGRWGVFCSDGACLDAGAVLAVVDWPGRVAAVMQSTAMVTPQRGLITRAAGRTLYEIDGRPAAEVYNQWLGGALHQLAREGGSVFSESSLQPLGVRRPRGASHYVLIHPESVEAGTGALRTFKALGEGEEVWLMKASRAGFIGRPAAVVERLLVDARLPAAQVSGAFLFYCAGCRLTVNEGTPLMLAGFRGALGHVPFTTGYFFGEQGCAVPNGPAEHGNLMTGALLLGLA